METIGRYFDNRLAAAILPLIPLFLGASVKFSVIDTVGQDPMVHIYDNYVVGAWVELLSISMVSIVAWGYAAQGSHPNMMRELAVLVSAIVIVLVLCIIFRFGGPKMGYSEAAITVATPNVLSLAALCVCSMLIREFSK